MAIGKAVASAIQEADKMRVWETSQVSAPAGEACEGTSKMQRRQMGILRERLSVPYACYETVNTDFKGKDGKEWNGNEKSKMGISW